MVIHITSSTDSSLEGTHYILIQDNETPCHARKLSLNYGTKTLTYKDALHPVLNNLTATAHALAYEWEDSATSDKGLILIRFSYNTTDFTVHDSVSLDININGFLRMNNDNNDWFFIIWKEDDGTLSIVQLHAAGFSLKNFVKLRMPVYQEIWGLMISLGPSHDYIFYVDNNKFTII